MRMRSPAASTNAPPALRRRSAPPASASSSVAALRPRTGASRPATQARAAASCARAIACGAATRPAREARARPSVLAVNRGGPFSSGGGVDAPKSAAWRARMRGWRRSAFAGSSSQSRLRARSQSRRSARRARSSGRSSATPRPCGQAGEGAQSRNRPIPGASPSRIRAFSSASSAVWAKSTTRAPASRAASASRRWRAARAAAGTPVVGLGPSHASGRQSAPTARAISPARRVQSALSGCSR